MNKAKEESLSKYLCYVLRHKPEKLGLTLEPGGWVNIYALLDAVGRIDNRFATLAELEQVVANDSKGRFSLKDEKIRCNQGHSVNIDLHLEEKIPPMVLYHGTSNKYLDSIKNEGILKGNRHHVHLSEDLDTAIAVGKRHGGNPVVLHIDAKSMHSEGYKFYMSTNNVWLTDLVPVEYILNEESNE
jgi:putative RNA 2'-phosphotransferase